MKKPSELINKKLDKIIELLERQCSLIISGQLMTECVAPDGTPREAEECASIVTESYSAALCLESELLDRNKHYDYQCAEFFVDESDEDGDEGPDLGNPSLVTLS